MFIRYYLKALLILVLLTVLNATVAFAKEQYTGTPIPDFQGIPWRATSADIEQWASERNAKLANIINRYDGIMTTLIFTGTYAEELAEFRFTLYRGQFYQVNIYCESIPQSLLIDRWQKFKQLLSQKYGLYSDDFYYFDRPYYKGDGYELQAIRLGKGTAKTYWKRPTGNGENVILDCIITPYSTLRVGYQNVEIADVAVDEFDRLKAKNM